MRRHSQPSCALCFGKTGWFMPRLPLAGLSTCCSTWPAIPIGWPSRIIAFSRWKDYAHHRKCRAMTLTAEEFLRRFLQHVLPKGFPRIRYFGWFANRRRRELLPLCRRLLAVAPPPAEANSVEPAVWQCPICGSPMRVVELLTAAQIQREQEH